MNHRLFLIALLAALLMLIVVAAPTAADDLITVDEEGTATSGEPAPPGIDAVAWRYDFGSSAGTYTEIVSGTVHGTPSNDDTSFNAVDIGFTFTYDGVDYTQVSINSNGFLAMGPTVSSSYTPISTGSSNNVIAALARDLEGYGVGTSSELRSETLGTAPNRVFVVQWKDYKRYSSGTTYDGDYFDFQIRLYETSNLVEIMYGDVTVLAGSAAATVQVGLRGASNADYNNRMTDATHDWSDSFPGAANNSTMDLSDAIYPPSGLTYQWPLAVGLFLTPEAQSGSTCPGGEVLYSFEVANATGVPQSFILSYDSIWDATGPATTGEIPNGGSAIVNVSVHVPWAANAGDSDVLTVTAADATATYTDTATATTTAALFGGYTDYSNVPVGREVRAPGVVYWDGKLYKIGGYGYVSGSGAARDWVDIYDIATDTWTTGANLPGARYWIDCEAIDAKIYCAGGYSTSGQTALYIYDIATDTWTTGANPLPAYRYNYASVQLGGKYYLIGGYAAGYTPTMIVYDPVSDTWDQTLASMNTARRYFHAGVIGGKIYVSGGYNGSYLASAEVYDPATDTWTYIADMPSTWVNAADGVVYDRYLLLTGGTPSSTSGASNGALIYDAVTGTWDWLPLLDRLLYSAEGDGDGTSYWTVSGRMYDGAWSNSPYTTLLDECAECVPVSTADFTFTPPVPRPGLPAVFTGSADGSPPTAFDWDFGDGGFGAGQVYTYTYASPGTYTTVMTATNCDGASWLTVTHPVTVEAGPLVSVDPLALASTQCPDSQMTYTLSICNTGDQPLDYILYEQPATGLLVYPSLSLPETALGPGQSVELGIEAASAPGGSVMTSPPTPDAAVTLALDDDTMESYVGISPAAPFLFLNRFTPAAGEFPFFLNQIAVYIPSIGNAQVGDDIVLVVYENTTGNADPAVGSNWLASYPTTVQFVDAWTVYVLATPVRFDGPGDVLIGVIALETPATNYQPAALDTTASQGRSWIGWWVPDPLPTPPTLPPSSVWVLMDNAGIPGNWMIQGFGETTLDIPWLSEDPVAGSVPAGTCTDVDVIFDSTGMAPGTYTGTLQVVSNDTTNPVVDVDVSLTVAGGPTNVDFTFDPAAPWIDEVVTFNGTADALLPVDYTWDFGDGTLGAGQGITHTYGAAGDYTVTMTATVCAESVVVTHVVSVQTCWSVLDEHFETAFPPVDWTVIDNGGTCVWQRNDAFATPRPNYAGGDGYCADADSDRCGSGSTMDTELRTMVLDLTGMTTATLEYVTAYNDIGAGGDLADVDVSTDGGTTWTNLLQWDEDHSPNGPGEWVSLDLTPYAGQTNVMVRFHYYVATYDWWWEVDQVNVGGCFIEGAAPDIVVTPTELEQTLYPDQAADQTFNIANIGLLPLDWMLDEGCGTPVDWLALDPLAGTTPVGGNVDITVSFDSTGLAVGTYQTDVCVNSNDPVSPTVIVEVTLIVTGAPEIAVTPLALHSTQMPDVQVTLPLTVCNVGAAPLTWSLFESNPVLRVLAAPDAGPTAPAAEYPVITSEAQCADYQDSTGPEPIGWAEFCTDGFVPPAPAQPGPLAPTDIGYAQDIGYISDNFVTYVLNNFPGQTVIGTSTNAYYGMDFDPSATILYALNDTTDELGVIDLTTGAFTGLVSCPPGGGAANWTGLSIGADGTFWASTSTNLFTIDPTTGVSTLVGPFNAGGTMIEIAINMDGQMYGHDITTDSIYSVDTATGAATLVGPTGLAANYAQGMDFDFDDGTLYIFAYTGSGTNTFGTVNLATGAVTPLAVNSPLGEFEGAIQVAALVDIPWLSEDPITGTLDVGLCQVVDVTFDSTALALGDYFAGLRFESNDPYIPEVYVPVTLTVAVPDITVEPQSLATELCPEQTDVLTFTICNTGTFPLYWTLREGEAMAPFLGATSFTFQAPGGVVDVPDLDLSAPGVEGAPSTPVSPEDVLWDQPTNSVGAPASQYFPDFGAGLWSADDFDTNGEWWAIESIYVPGSLWNGNPQGDLYDADSLNWFIYADAGNMPPAGVYPDDGSGTEVWALSLPPTDPAVTIGGATNNEATLNHMVFGGPLVLPPGHYWLVFFPAMNFTPHGQFGWQTSGTTNLASAHFADPDGLIAPLDWTPWGVAINPAYYDAAFRIEGYVTEPQVDIPWLSESPTGGVVDPGLCQTVEVTFTAPITPGDYFANLLVESNDPDTPLITIPVSLTVFQPATIVDVTYVLNDLEVTFDATVSGTAPVSYTWDFGDGATSTEEDPIHVYDAGGCYTVTLTAYNDCGEDVWTEQICVCDPVTLAEVEYLVDGLQVTFDATVSGTEPITFAWDFGDGNTSDVEDPIHVYDAGGCYTVTLTVENGCGTDAWTEQICVCDPVSGLDFGWTPDFPVAGDEVLFAATAQGTEPIAFDWDFGDDTLGAGITATHAYTQAGDYLVTVMATNCDGDYVVMTHTITIAAACVPVSNLDFTWLPALPTAGVEVSFAATADGTLPITFDWDFGDGNTATGQNPTHTFTAAGDYLVEVTATNCDGISATKSYTVTVEAARRYYYLPIIAKD